MRKFRFRNVYAMVQVPSGNGWFDDDDDDDLDRHTWRQSKGFAGSPALSPLGHDDAAAENTADTFQTIPTTTRGQVARLTAGTLARTSATWGAESPSARPEDDDEEERGDW